MLAGRLTFGGSLCLIRLRTCRHNLDLCSQGIQNKLAYLHFFDGLRLFNTALLPHFGLPALWLQNPALNCSPLQRKSVAL